MTHNEFELFYQQTQLAIERCLKKYLPQRSPCALLQEAMHYSCLNGGKRVRAMLVYASGELCDVARQQLDVVASALEIMHAFSLIHDDLPAMDDDDLRRGQPTCHIAFDEATAILAGDALHNLAFELLSDEQHLPLTAEIRVTLIQQLANAVGAQGMVAGQALDVHSEQQQLTLKQQEQLHHLKTGRLIEAAILMPLAMSAYRQNAAYQQALSHYATQIGILFQIQDDILDITSDSATLGKTAGKDQSQIKSTYPSILGLDQAKHLATQHYQKACHAIALLPNSQTLHSLASFIITRER